MDFTQSELELFDYEEVHPPQRDFYYHTLAEVREIKILPRTRILHAPGLSFGVYGGNVSEACMFDAVEELYLNLYSQGFPELITFHFLLNLTGYPIAIRFFHGDDAINVVH